MNWKLDVAKMSFFLRFFFGVETDQLKMEIQRTQNSENNIEKKTQNWKFYMT